MIDLSLVVCSLPHRKQKLDKLLDVLMPQIDDRTELIIISDTSKQSDKLNRIKKIIKGKYTTIIDDDDLVSDNFVKSILEHTNKDLDMIGYTIYYKEGNLLENTDNKKPYRFIHHTYRTALLKKFPVSHGVWDPPYVYSLDIKTWFFIEDILYYYMYDPSDTGQNTKQYE